MRVNFSGYRTFLTVWTALGFLTLASVAEAVTGPGSSNNFGGRRVMAIGIDGVQRAALQTAINNGSAPNLASIANGGVAYWGMEAGGRYRTETQQPTITGPGWSAVCTATFMNKNGIEDNDTNKMVDGRFYLYPHFFKHIREVYPDSWLASICDATTPNTVLTLSGAGLADYVYSPTTAEKNAGLGDVKVAEQVVSVLGSKNPDAVFVHFLDCDHAGHTYGYGSPNYMTTLSEIDGYIGEILTAMQNRPQYAQEKWLVVVTSDHGGGLMSKSHGSQSDDDRHIVGFFNGPGFTGGAKIYTRSYQSLVAPTILAYLGIAVNPQWGMEDIPAPSSPAYPTPRKGISLVNPRRDTRNPKSTDIVKFSVDVQSMDNVTGVNLMVDADTGTFTSLPMSLSGGTCYEANVGPYPSGTIVKYYLQANTATQTTKLPFPLAPLPYYVYTVNDEVVDDTDLVINEIMYNPPGSDNGTNPEWMEFVNRRSTPLDVSYYTVADTVETPDDFTIPGGTVIPANGYMIIAWDKPKFLVKYPALASDPKVIVVDGAQAYGLNNDGDSPCVVRPNDRDWNNLKSEPFEQVRYRIVAPWPPTAPDGYSLELINPVLDNNQGENWQLSASSGGTPGKPNSAFAAGRVGIFNVERSLEYPTPTDLVSISADILSDVPVSLVRLIMKKGSQSYTLQMTNLGGTRWRSFIGTAPSGTAITYYIEAEVPSGITRWPAGAPANQELFRVDDHPVRAGDLVINEINYDPPGTDNRTQPEWFEVYNKTPYAQDLGYFKYRVRRDQEFSVIPPGTVIPPYGYLVVAGRLNLFNSTYPSFPSTGAVVISPEWAEGSSTMTNSNNSQIEVRVTHPNTYPVNMWTPEPAVTIGPYRATNYPWPGDSNTLANSGGHTLELKHPSLDNTRGENWAVSLVNKGTPGAKNSVNSTPSAVSEWSLY